VQQALDPFFQGKAQPACMQMWDDIALSVASFVCERCEEAGIIPSNRGGPDLACLLDLHSPTQPRTSNYQSSRSGTRWKRLVVGIVGLRGVIELRTGPCVCMGFLRLHFLNLKREKILRKGEKNSTPKKTPPPRFSIFSTFAIGTLQSSSILPTEKKTRTLSFGFFGPQPYLTSDVE
jgi:hypothetical protein